MDKLRADNRLVKAAAAIRDPAPEKVANRILLSLDAISTRKEEPGPATRERRRLEGLGLWKDSTPRSGDSWRDSDELLLESQRALPWQ